jgi:hypothetical protein
MNVRAFLAKPAEADEKQLLAVARRLRMNNRGIYSPGKAGYLNVYEKRNF